MNEYYYTYSKVRQDFGRPFTFETTEPKLLGSVPCRPEIKEAYTKKNPRTFTSDNLIELSEHTVNTERVSTSVRCMRHVEGGWPKDIDSMDLQETSKWRKRAERDPGFLQSVKHLTSEATKYLKQNDSVQLFSDSFEGSPETHQTDALYVKSILLLKDQHRACKRTATCIAWHPDGPQKLAVGYGNLKFQSAATEKQSSAYLWDVDRTNAPLHTLKPPSALVSCQFNNKMSDLFIGGCYNGQVCLWDFRKSMAPVEQSVKDTTHYDPVYSVVWIQSKTNNEFVSTSTDGRVLWWDTRNLNAPVDTCLLTHTNDEVLGGVALEWSAEAGPTKFLVGTEQGLIYTLKTRQKKSVEIVQRFGAESGQHFSPVFAVKRNPFFSKYFLSVGDWTAKVWMEDIKTPIIRTPYHEAQIINGQWSPTRPGLFMVCRSDGFVDFWDYFYRQNEVAFQHKVSSASLWSIAAQAQGQLVAVGDSEGTVTLLDLCPALYTGSPQEKVAVGQMFEREARREKNIEVARRQQESKKVEGDRLGGNAGGAEKPTEFDLQKITEDFFTGMCRPEQSEAKEKGEPNPNL